jgi:CRISPR-associated protein Csm3
MMRQMEYGFDRFLNQIKIEGSLRLRSPLHIGGGSKDYFGSDSPVVKMADGKPYIPGSSLKGVLRSFLERIARSGALDHESYAPPCMVNTQEETMCLKKYNGKKERDEKRKELGSEEAFVHFLAEESCPICHLFGNNLLSAKVRISDAPVKIWSGQYDFRHGVGIDRDTGIASRGVKYDFEAVPAGTEFTFSLTADNLEELEKRWLLIALESLRQGRILLGGLTARGLGHVEGVNWSVQEVTKDNIIPQLLGTEVPAQPFELFLTAAFKKGGK